MCKRIPSRMQAYSQLAEHPYPQRRGRIPSRMQVYSQTLRHEISPSAYSRVPSVRGNGPSAGTSGRYDTKSAHQRTLANQASGEMVLPRGLPDTTTRNQAHSVLSRTKRPYKWLFRGDFRTLRHEISPSAYSRGPNVRTNGPSAGFRGRYDTESAQQRSLTDQASG